MLHDRSSPGFIDPRVFNPIIAVLGRAEALNLLRALVAATDTSWPQMQQAHQQGRVAELGRLAHKLAGSCGSLGVALLEGALRELEQACRQDDPAAMDAVMARLPQLIETMREDAENFCGIPAGG